MNTSAVWHSFEHSTPPVNWGCALLWIKEGTDVWLAQPLRKKRDSGEFSPEILGWSVSAFQGHHERIPKPTHWMLALAPVDYLLSLPEE
jgi:hypothetical protein